MKSLTIYTDGGARTYDGVQCAGWGFYAIDEEEKEYTGYGAAGNTNNHVAEVLAAIHAIEFVLLNNVHDVQMFLDSEYVIIGMNKIHDGVMPNTNKERWKHLEDLRQRVMDRNINIQFDWVKGHNGNVGNERADVLATRGVLMQKNSDTIPPADVYEGISTDAVIEELPTKKVREEKLDPLHLLLTGREWFFKTNLHHTLPDNRFYYGTVTYEKDKKADSKNVKKNAGKVASDSHYSLMVTRESIPMLDVVKAGFDNLAKTEQAPVLVNLDVIKKKDNWKELNKNHSTFVEYKTSMGVLANSELVGNILRPPLLSYRLMEYFKTGMDLIEWFEKKDHRLVVHKVTDFFIKADEKSRHEMTKNYGMADRFIVMKDVPLLDGRKIDVQLTAGIDIPLRNQINNMVKQDVREPVDIYLVIWDIFSRSYHCATIITRKDDIAVYYTGESTYRIIDEDVNKKKKKTK